MKRILSLSLVLLFVISCVAIFSPVYASENNYDDYIIVGDFEMIVKNGVKYLPLDNDNLSIFAEDASYVEAKFQDPKTEELHSYTDVRIFPEFPHLIHVYTETENDYFSFYYVAEGTWDHVQSVVKGEYIYGYLTESHYYSIENLSINKSVIEGWSDPKNAVTMPAKKMEYYEQYPLYSVDKFGSVGIEVGMIIAAENDELYLINYSEYDRSHFYADGSFAFDTDEEVTFYLLNDNEWNHKLINYYDIVPNDELDWLFGDALPDEVILCITAILFAIIPLGVICLCTVLLIKKRPKNPYCTIYRALIVCCAVIAVCYVIILIYLN